MTDTRGFRTDGTHNDTGVARDPQGYNQAGEHISQSTNTRGLRGSQPPAPRVGSAGQNQPRQRDGKFGEKAGASPEVALVDGPLNGSAPQTAYTRA